MDILGQSTLKLIWLRWDNAKISHCIKFYNLIKIGDKPLNDYLFEIS